jgi:hypothetical protein
MCHEVVSGGWDHVSDSNQGVLWSCKPTFGISRPFLGAISSEEKKVEKELRKIMIFFQDFFLWSKMIL